MAEHIIEVENLSKIYRLGKINTGSLRDDVQRWWSLLNGKDDPYEKLAETNDRATKAGSGVVWSLKDINFSVAQGEVLGIIGKNGAGKSTLLKLLSKITKPTKGVIRIDGRIASLLEVGTGFHPDLSGRENIFLNGSILGMRKHEIKARFDEIVSFAGIERYIDTPVKRYSSGMFVRLAFAVAAHLEPEILIIDEVLAVGDAEFQQKCLGKMKDVSQNQGRTVLFVSHNVGAVKQLCSRAMLLEKGQVKMIGTVEKALELYQAGDSDPEQGKRNKFPDNSKGYFTAWQISGQNSPDAHSCYTRESFTLTGQFKALSELKKCDFHLMIKYDDGAILLHACSLDFSGRKFNLEPGIFNLNMQLSLPVRKGKYDVELGLASEGTVIDIWRTSTQLHVLDNFEGHSRDAYTGILNGKTHFSLEEATVLNNAYSL